MSPRETARTVLLGALGIITAIAIAAAANEITGSEVGLSAEPVSVIEAGGGVKPKPAPGFEREHGSDDGRSSDDATGTTAGDDSSGSGDGDDSSGSGSGQKGDDSSGRGSAGTTSTDDDRGSENSGSGSSGSGSGGSSSGKGSSGSGGGSDDPPGSDD
ncbi:MAG: hypothetical protein M3M99_06535 [Actinomycetota bacterium]|nr:hypothetical protein [Actinomycetota bacterium]